jgi:hypothetical protein
MPLTCSRFNLQLDPASLLGEEAEVARKALLDALSALDGHAVREPPQ